MEWMHQEWSLGRPAFGWLITLESIYAFGDSQVLYSLLTDVKASASSVGISVGNAILDSVGSNEIVVAAGPFQPRTPHVE